MSEAEQSDQDSPTYWIERFEGTPMAVVVPPYIRFLEGILVLRKAQIFLQRARAVALSGHPELSNILDELDQSKDTKRLGLSYETFFASQLTINLVSEVEHFFGSAVSAALRMYPEKMGAQSFKLVDIISANSNDELIDRAARTVLNKMMYAKPNDYIKGLAEILSIETTGLEKEWPVFVELKTRRDLGVHNNWVVNEIYLRKLRETNISSSHKMGDQLIPDFIYLEQATITCSDLVKKMADLLAEKWVPINGE